MADSDDVVISRGDIATFGVLSFFVISMNGGLVLIGGIGHYTIVRRSSIGRIFDQNGDVKWRRDFFSVGC